MDSIIWALCCIARRIVRQYCSAWYVRNLVRKYTQSNASYVGFVFTVQVRPMDSITGVLCYIARRILHQYCSVLYALNSTGKCTQSNASDVGFVSTVQGDDHIRGWPKQGHVECATISGSKPIGWMVSLIHTYFNAFTDRSSRSCKSIAGRL